MKSNRQAQQGCAGRGGRSEVETKENPRVREVEAPFVHGAFVTRMGISLAAIPENFIGTVVR